MRGWIGVDLDGTLAEYHGWVSTRHIGPPISPMLARVKQLLSQGHDVRIFTARVSEPDRQVHASICAWCLEHIGQVLPVTNKKDYQMVRLFDDRVVQVIPNTGITLEEEIQRLTALLDAAGIPH